MRRSVWRRSKERHAGSVRWKKRSGPPGVLLLQLTQVLVRVLVIFQSLPDCVSRWFQLGTNPHTGAEDWLYTGGYFDRNYTHCPNIYWPRRGRRREALQWDFTKICATQTPMPCLCVSGGGKKAVKCFFFQIHNCELKCAGDLQVNGEF